MQPGLKTSMGETKMCNMTAPVTRFLFSAFEDNLKRRRELPRLRRNAEGIEFYRSEPQVDRHPEISRNYQIMTD